MIKVGLTAVNLDFLGVGCGIWLRIEAFDFAHSGKCSGCSCAQSFGLCSDRFLARRRNHRWPVRREYDGQRKKPALPRCVWNDSRQISSMLNVDRGQHHSRMRLCV